MGLPKIQQPIFELTIPSTEQKVKYRPFTVKEEKILLIAQESKDIDQIVISIKQIIGNCIEGIDVDTLAMFDLEYILMNLRAKSVSNEIEFSIEDPETKEKIDLVMNVDDVHISKKDGHTKILKLSDNITLKMRYPKLDSMLRAKSYNEEDEIRQELIFRMMLDCIESVVQGDEVFVLDDFTEDEQEGFFESLSATHIGQIKEFFETMPVMRFETKYRRKDGTEKTFVAEGAETFFI